MYNTKYLVNDRMNDRKLVVILLMVYNVEYVLEIDIYEGGLDRFTCLTQNKRKLSSMAR